MSAHTEVLAAAERRSAALVARDAGALRDAHHPDLRWTTHLGDVRDRDAYVAGNTAGDLLWHGQRLEAVEIVVAGDTAILVGVAVDDVERDGRRWTHRMRLSQTWVRDAGGPWRCLAAHAGPRLD